MIPAYNEEASIEQIIVEIRTLYPAIDILVIDDGSHDQTFLIAKSTGAKVIHLPYNLGIGGAVQTGYKYAAYHGYDATIQIDGDAQHDPASIAAVLAPILDGSLDMCIGSRFLAPPTSFKSTPMRRLGIRFFVHLLGGLTGVQLTDPTAGFRATGKKLTELFANDYPIDFPEPEAIKLAARFKAKIGEVPANMRERAGGKSSIRYLSTLYYMIKVTFAILIDSLRRS